MKALRAAFVAVALIVMALPCALMPVLPTTLGAENRMPATFPKLQSDDGAFNSRFPSQYEAWLKDHVALRNIWIGLHSRILRALGTSSQDQVILGKGDWLFYRDMLNDYTGADPLTDNEIARMALVLDTVDAGLKAQGVSLTVAIIPNKGSIYPQYMPDAYPRRTTPTTFEQLTAASKVRFVPVKEALAPEADEGLYFHGDVHWNGFGARLGAKAILDSLSEAVGESLPSPDPGDTYEIKVDWPSDLTRMLDPYSEEYEPQQYYNDAHSFSYQGRHHSSMDMTINTKGGAADFRLLVLRDSFTNQLLEYLADAASEATFLRAMPLPLRDAASYDAVLLEMVERRLPELLDAPPAMVAPVTEVPGDLNAAEITGLRLERDDNRLFGALDEVPDSLVELCLGVRDGSTEAWYSAFPVSGVANDGDRGFSALLNEVSDDAEICVYARGDVALRTDWTPVSSAVISDQNQNKLLSDIDN